MKCSLSLKQGSSGACVRFLTFLAYLMSITLYVLLLYFFPLCFFLHAPLVVCYLIRKFSFVRFTFFLYNLNMIFTWNDFSCWEFPLPFHFNLCPFLWLIIKCRHIHPSYLSRSKSLFFHLTQTLLLIFFPP